MGQSRRSFLKTAALSATSFAILPKWAAGAEKAPSSKLNVAFIGVGGRGEWACRDLCTFDKVNPVCFVDVDDKNAATTYKRFPDVPRMRDYRKMFDKYGKDIDAVVISTPDHAHFPICMEAMALGLPIVATDCPCGGPRTVMQDGYNGLLVPIKDEDAMAAGICRLIENPEEAERLGENARKIAEIANGQAVFEQWRDYIETLIG